MLGPAAITTALADLGAEVIKVEPPAGDYVRRMTWPIVEGVSLMHLHVNRGKRSIVIDLKSAEGDRGLRGSGGLERRGGRGDAAGRASPGAGLGFDRMRELNPRIVFCTISGYGATGPVPRPRQPRHCVRRVGRDLRTRDRRRGLPVDSRTTCRSGSTRVRCSARSGSSPGVIQARATGEGAQMEVAQSDSAAAFDWYREETYRAYERPESEVTGNTSDDFVRREPAIAGMRGGVRYQVYASADGYVLFMASEQHFWKKFCTAVERTELFERVARLGVRRPRPREPRAAGRAHRRSSRRKSTERVGAVRHRRRRADRAVSHPEDRGRRPAVPGSAGVVPHRGARRRAAAVPGEDRRRGARWCPRRRPTVGEHTDAVLADVLGYDAARIAALRATGAVV